MYHPLVADNAAQVGVPPVLPVLPPGAIVGLWFGANGDVLTLANAVGTTSMVQANCINGVAGSNFGQYASCNAKNFFAAANLLIVSKAITIPSPGNTFRGDACPTTRSFPLVDQDPADNVLSTYLITTDLKVAQATLKNFADLTVITEVANGSDNRLLDRFMLPALQCEPMVAPDLIDPTVMRPSLALNEISATLTTGGVVALIPSGDPMVLNNGKPDLVKLNAYRTSVNQNPLPALVADDTKIFCQNFKAETGPFFAMHAMEFSIAPSPDKDISKNLLGFLADRYQNAWILLKCDTLLGEPSPIIATADDNGFVTSTNIEVAYGKGDPIPGFFMNNDLLTAKVKLPVSTVLFICAGIVLLFVILNVIIYVRITSKGNDIGGRV